MGLLTAVLFAFILPHWVLAINKEDPGVKCHASTSGKTVIVNDMDGDEIALICLKSDGKFNWKVLNYYHTLGEFFNPAKDCSDIVRRRHGAKTGLYWIKGLGLKKSMKVWCDVTTDGGGFMLVGSKQSPVTWTVPSNATLVTPDGAPHWSSEFGDVSVIEFRIQVSTTNDQADLKADWLYHFTNPRRFAELMVSENGSGCKTHYPGIGHVEFVKDLLVGKVVTRNFHCSRFGPAYPKGLGWQMMNKCLKSPCSSGFAIIPGINLQYDQYGGFSFSTSSPRSGIRHNSTAFVGCDNGKCCACFGPKGATGDFCSPGCKSINGGTVSKSAHVWFWIRSSIPPSPVWKKCAEFKMRTGNKTYENFFVHPKSGIVEKGNCRSKNNVPNFIDGIVDVENEEALQKVPQIKGLLSYRNDNRKLYVTNGKLWDALGKETTEKNISRQLGEDKAQLQSELNQLKADLKKQFQVLENDIKVLKSVPKGVSCSNIKKRIPFATSGVYWITPGSGTPRSFQVYCDMETSGGGWTLVYSYTFTNYNNFNTGANAVTPRPNWHAPTASVPISTTPPLSESSRGAVDYNLWKHIGNDVLIKSNINDWIVCQPNGGSLVAKKDGGMSCQNIKHVAPKCHTPPSSIYWLNVGPSFNKYFYLFDGETSSWCPTHDFCNSCDDHKKGVPNPGGTIYIR